jgi:hypothetical protein
VSYIFRQVEIFKDGSKPCVIVAMLGKSDPDRGGGSSNTTNKYL